IDPHLSADAWPRTILDRLSDRTMVQQAQINDDADFAYCNFVALIVKRPGARTVAAAVAPAIGPAKPVAESKDQAAVPARPSNNPFILELVQITQQTSDTKTLRFVVHGPQRLDALPGQFLTFSFLFDGKK